MEYGGGFNTDSGFSTGESSQKLQQIRTTLTPVTIKQINEAKQPVPDGEFQVNNVSLSLVSFVGIVREVQDHTSHISITIEDGTGAVEIKKWVNDAENSSTDEAMARQQEMNKYVYVTCTLKEFSGKTSLQNATIKPITDHNEILYHNLSAIQNHLKAQGLSSNATTSSSGGNDLFVKDDNMDGLQSMQDKILAVIHENSHSMQEGVPVPFISQQLGISDNVVSENCATLVEEGKIYTGYDDSAYLAI